MLKISSLLQALCVVNEGRSLLELPWSAMCMAGCLRLCFMQKKYGPRVLQRPSARRNNIGLFPFRYFLWNWTWPLCSHHHAWCFGSTSSPTGYTPGRLSGLSCISLYKKPSGEHNPWCRSKRNSPLVPYWTRGLYPDLGARAYGDVHMWFWF